MSGNNLRGAGVRQQNTLPTRFLVRRAAVGCHIGGLGGYTVPVVQDADGYREGVGYGLWWASFLGLAGLHRIYLGKCGG